LLLQAGAGDELQGIKRGIMELADVFAVGKADGSLREAALRARSEVAAAVRLLPPLRPGWTPPVLAVSALDGDGLAELWERIQACAAFLHQDGRLADLRRNQELAWFRELLEEAVLADFQRQPVVAGQLPRLQTAVAAGEISAELAALQLLGVWRGEDA
jgi:LAO/AO transport system kinase